MDSHYKNLDVWKKSIEFVERIYRVTEDFPKREMYSLSDQMCRAAISIPSNITEWSGRSSNTDYSQFLFMAKGSAMEIETQIIIAMKLQYLGEESGNDLLSEIEIILKMLTKFIQYKKGSYKTIKL